jgi:hypothetical protein
LVSSAYSACLEAGGSNWNRSWSHTITLES